MNRFELTKFPLENKTVFLRVDFNVPMNKGKVLDNAKIKATLPTIEYLLKQNCKIVLATHLGRPKGKKVKGLTVTPLVKELQNLLRKVKITKLNDCIGKDIKAKIKRGLAKEIFFLENLRFYKEEKENDMLFAHSLADLADVYVNDAFGVSHRKHASLSGIARFIPAIAGLLVEKELFYLSKALVPKRPAVWILGGAKFDKVELIEQALSKADYVIIGGALAFSFLKAQGIGVGMSKLDYKSVQIAKRVLQKKEAQKIILPRDFVTATSITAKTRGKVVSFNKLESNQIGLDLGPETINLFKHYLRKAHTVFWNGPLGYFELAQYGLSTKEIGRFIGRLTATSVCGGGETSLALSKFHLADKITHISTGGGAALQFLEGNTLPAIKALEMNYLKFRKGV
jgi:phosphoglycerate kinase